MATESNVMTVVYGVFAASVAFSVVRGIQIEREEAAKNRPLPGRQAGEQEKKEKESATASSEMSIMSATKKFIHGSLYASVGVARILLYPSLSAMAVASLALNARKLFPASMSSYFLSSFDLMRIFPELRSKYDTAAVSKLVPLYARNLTEAFEIGQIYHLYQAAVATANDTAIADALARAGRLLNDMLPDGASSITAEQLKQIPERLMEIDGQNGLMQHFFSALDIVNTIQLVSLLVLIAFFAPFLFALFGKPLVKLWILCVDYVVLPIHRTIKPLYEPLCYVGAVFLATESARYPLNDPLSRMGTNLAAGSILMLVLSWFYTLNKVHDKRSASSWSRKREEAIYFYTCLVAAAYSIPLAILHQSTTLGYVSSFSVIGLFGFTMHSYGLCFVVGFDSKQTLARCTVACALLSLLSVTSRIMETSSISVSSHQHVIMAPFEQPVALLSTAVFFLGMLILAEVQGAHAQFVVTAALYIGVGETVGLYGMANAAKVWLSLWCFTRYCRLCIWNGRNTQRTICIFLGAVASYGVTSYLQKNPRYITEAVFGTLSRS